MTVRINKQKINLREKLAGVEDKVNFDQVVRGLGEYGGNVGIGTTNPVYNLHLANSSSANFLIQRTTPGGQVDGITLNSVAGTGINNRTGDISLIMTSAVGDSEPALRFSTTNGSQGTQHAMFISNGKVGFGTTNPGVRLDVRGGDTTYAAQFIATYTDPGSASYKGIKIQAGMGNSGTAGNNKWIEFYNGNGSTIIGGIQNTSNTTVAFFSGSDRRIKKNINDTSIKGIDSIKALKLRSWDWNSTEPMTSVDIGLIADELEEVYPELVSRQKMKGWEHCIGEGEEDLKTIPTESKITLTLVKAIQEQQTISEDLKSRIETFEQQ